MNYVSPSDNRLDHYFGPHRLRSSATEYGSCVNDISTTTMKPQPKHLNQRYLTVEDHIGSHAIELFHPVSRYWTGKSP